ARLSAYSNLTWDLGNGSDWYRKWPEWADQMGAMVKKWDPYEHLDSVHTEDVQNQRRASAWFDMTLVQWWTRPVHDWMLAQRREQSALGRIIPQVNEEYGYEDHYPTRRSRRLGASERGILSGGDRKDLRCVRAVPRYRNCEPRAGVLSGLLVQSAHREVASHFESRGTQMDIASHAGQR